MASVLRRLGRDSSSDAGGAELLFLLPAERADSRADGAGAACAGARPAGRLGTLRTLPRHLQRRLRLAGVGQRSLNVGHRLAGWRHGGNGAAGEESRVGTDGDRGRAVMVVEGR